MTYQIEEKDKFWLVSLSNDGMSIADLHNYLVSEDRDFHNTILDLSESEVSIDNREALSSLARDVMAANASFVAVGDGLDWLGAEAVPTMTEARDIVFMEMLERELGEDLNS